MDFSRKPLPMSRRDFVTSSAAVLATSRFAPMALENAESSGGLGQAATPRGQFRVIIDTDPGVDDALALLLAMRSPELKIEAITPVAGNVPLDLTLPNALRMVEIAGRTDILVAAGARAPLMRRHENIGAAGDFNHAQGVRQRQVERHVSGDRSDGFNLQLRRAHGQQEGQSVVDSRVGVNDDAKLTTARARVELSTGLALFCGLSRQCAAGIGPVGKTASRQNGGGRSYKLAPRNSRDAKDFLF